MKTVSLKVARQQIAILWFIGCGALGGLLIAQSSSGHYGARVGDVWAWWLPNVMPSLSLITGVVIAEWLKERRPTSVGSFSRNVVMSISCVYLLIIGFTITISPLNTQITPLNLMKMSNLWLAPLQGIVTASVGILFAKSR